MPSHCPPALGLCSSRAGPPAGPPGRWAACQQRPLLQGEACSAHLRRQGPARRHRLPAFLLLCVLGLQTMVKLSPLKGALRTLPSPWALLPDLLVPREGKGVSPSLPSAGESFVGWARIRAGGSQQSPRPSCALPARGAVRGLAGLRTSQVCTHVFEVIYCSLLNTYKVRGQGRSSLGACSPLQHSWVPSLGGRAGPRGAGCQLVLARKAAGDSLSEGSS